MAKQVGPLFFTGTVDGLIFYKVGEQYFIRSKGSYKSAKHMRRNPRYKRTMQNADQFGEASKLVRNVYYQYLPKSIRKRGLYGLLTGKVKQWLQEGKDAAYIKEALIAYCMSLQPTATETVNRPSIPNVTTNAHSTMGVDIVCPKQRVVQPTCKVKKARYLSKWNVKQNGKMHVSKERSKLLEKLPDLGSDTIDIILDSYSDMKAMNYCASKECHTPDYT